MDDFTNSAAALVMRNLRRGTVLMPAELKRALRSLQGRRPMTEHALAVNVPNWLVDALERQASAPQLRFSVYPTLDPTDKVLASALQCDSTQLRLAMVLSEPAVQAFLAEALPARKFCFVLGIEHSTQNAAMGASLSADQADWLVKSTSGARPGPLGLAPAVQLAVLQAHPDCVPSLVEGKSVTDVVSALITSRPQVDVTAAVHAAVLPDRDEPVQATFH